jgi:Immunity protein 53
MLSALEQWYGRECNGDWEHQWGVEIRTLDNPGWSVRIDLAETTKQGASLAKVSIERSDRDWIFYSVAENRFHQRSGNPFASPSPRSCLILRVLAARFLKLKHLETARGLRS